MLLKTGALQSAIFNSANFSSIATDAKGVIQIFNVGAERMLGYTAAEVMNKITPADISDPQEVIARAEALSLELGTPITPGFEALVFKASRGIEDIYELTYFRKDGSRFPAVVSVTALRDAQDAIIGYLLIGTDNTARKQAEEVLHKAGAELERLRAEAALRASEQHYRTLFESINEGFCIIEKIGDGVSEPLDFRYIEANPAFAVQSGISGVAGKTLRQVLPDEFEQWLVTYDTVLGTGEPTRFERGLITQGRVLEVHAFRVEDATHQRVAINFKDITERKQAEHALREGEAFSRSIIKNSPDCIKVLDLEGNLLSMQSGQALLGIEDIHPFLNTSWIDFWEGEHRQAAQSAVSSALTGVTARFVGFFRTLRGEAKWWDVSVSPIFDTDGKPDRLLAVSRDVTARRQAELNSEFLASASRDLVHWTSVDEMMQSVGAKVAAHLHLSLCAFAEINEAAEQLVIQHNWHRQDVPSMAGVYRLADFVEAEFIRLARTAEVIVVCDVVKDLCTDPAKFATLNIKSFICVPLIQDGQWRFALCLYKDVAYDWREDEIELARELTARIWTRLQRLRTEEALRKSEGRVRHALDSAELGTWSVDPATGLFTSDARFKAIFGISVEGFDKEQALAHIHPDDHVRIEDAVAAAIRPDDPVPYEVEYRVSHSDGSLHWVFAKGRAAFAGSGAQRLLVNFAGTVADVTARKQAENDLLQRTAQFKTLIDEAPLGIHLIDANFRIRQVNSTGRPAFGNIPDLIGRDYAEVMHIVWPAAQADAAVNKFRHTLETGEPCFVPEMIERRADKQTIEYYEWQINRIPLPEGGFGVVCYFRDISVRVRAQQQIRESEERYRNLFNSMDEGYCIIEMIFDEQQKPVDWRYLEVNPSFEKQTGIIDITGKRIRQLVPDHEEYWFEIYGKVALTGEPVRFINEAKAMNRWFDLYAFRVGGEDSRKVAILFTNITAAKEADSALRESVRKLRKTEMGLRATKTALSNEKAALDDHVIRLQLVNKNLIATTNEAHALAEEIEISRIKMVHLAQHDALTDLPNRNLLNDRLAQAISLAQRQGKQFALMFVDMDRFKYINDSLGHGVGDQLLQVVAKRLMACVRSSDTVCRQGGDEFLILLGDVEQAEDAALSAQKILAALTVPYLIDQLDIHITVSIGISIYPDDAQNADALIKSADTAMYHAKTVGRNNYQFFEQDMNVRAVERHFIEGGLRYALERQEFILHYQPKINLESGTISGVEALIRWQHPQRGLVLPDDFIWIAEDCGLIVPIGAWVLREACRQAQAWQDAGLPPVPVAVNISAVQFRHKDFLEGVAATLKETGLAPHYLELELTESVLMQDADSAASVLKALKAIGVRLAIDDFGIGYSSLSYLKRFPIDTLKIDQSFLRDITDASAESDDTAIILAVVSMGKSLNQCVIAEGVETSEQLAFLKAQGCTEGQGFYFSQPVSADEFSELLRKGITASIFD
ncbi:MAG: EAL domain-containing protein [Gammaproteobacteria bacterium]